MVLKIAHRGGSKYAPENSLEAFKDAIKSKVDGVELDVHLTKDGKVIVMHDENVKRTTDGYGLIKDLTMKQIRMFHRPNGEPVPTLQDVIDIIKGKCFCIIEIKDEGMEKKVIAIIKKNKIAKTTIISSKLPDILRKVKKIAPKIKTDIIIEKPLKPDEIIKEAEKTNAKIIASPDLLTTKELVEKAHKKGLKIYVWTVNKKKNIEKFKAMRVDGIMTDYPDTI